MSDWYKDITANLEYEKEMQERYSEWKLTSKIWQERAERMKALAAQRKELLRKMYKYYPHLKPLEMLDEELGDD